MKEEKPEIQNDYIDESGVLTWDHIKVCYEKLTGVKLEDGDVGASSETPQS